MTCLERCLCIVFIWFLYPGGQMLSAQNKSFSVDTLTTIIDGELPPYNEVTPGDTLLLEHGTRDFILIRNFQGNPDSPIVIINGGGVVKISTDHYYGISIRNCRYFRFTGTGDLNHFYGFMIIRVESGGGIGIGDKSSDYEIDHVSIEHCTGVGIGAKTDPDCSFTSTREKFTQFNTLIHDNYISDVSYEGLYIGSTKYFGQLVECDSKDTLLFPSLLDGVRIYNNIIKFTGWDGIQVSSASSNCQVYDNMIMFDSQDEFYGQMSGILLGGGSKCDCNNNYISQGKGNGIENHGLGGYRIYNNVIVDAGRSFLPLDSSEMRHGISVSDVSVQPDSSFFILFNDIINPKSDGIRFSSKLSRNNLVASNVIINPGNFDFYEHGSTSFKGKDAYVMIPDPLSQVMLKNNYFARNQDSTGFSDTDFTLLPGSPLIDAGYFENKGINFDFYDHVRPYGNSYDIGAHEFNPAFLGISKNHAELQAGVNPYPNPVKESFSLRFQVTRQSRIILDIYNLEGNQTGHVNWGVLEKGNHAKSINVADLPGGIYLFILRTGNQDYSGRFVKISPW